MCLAPEEFRAEFPISKMPSASDQARIKRALRGLSFRIDRVVFQPGGPGKEQMIRVISSHSPTNPEAAHLEIRRVIERFR